MSLNLHPPSMPANAASRSTSAANLHAVEESQAEGEVAEQYARFRTAFGRNEVPGIVKCFATNPSLLKSMMDLAEGFLFVDGQLTRKHKEMIATLVSSQNCCPYCADSHAHALLGQGGTEELRCALERNTLDSPSLTLKEQALMQFATKVNSESQAIARQDIESAMQAGWTEGQVAEAVHIAALFAAFNRMANAFGLPSAYR